MKPCSSNGGRAPKIRFALVLAVTGLAMNLFLAAAGGIVPAAWIGTSARADVSQTTQAAVEEWLKHILTVGGSSLPFNDVLLNFDDAACGAIISSLQNALVAVSSTNTVDPNPEDLVRYQKIVAVKALFEAKCGQVASTPPAPPVSTATTSPLPPTATPDLCTMKPANSAYDAPADTMKLIRQMTQKLQNDYDGREAVRQNAWYDGIQNALNRPQQMSGETDASFNARMADWKTLIDQSQANLKDATAQRDAAKTALDNAVGDDLAKEASAKNWSDDQQKLFDSCFPQEGALRRAHGPQSQSITVTCLAPTGQVCGTPGFLTFAADGSPGTWTVHLAAPAVHCSSVIYLAALAPGLSGSTGPLAAGQSRDVDIGRDLAAGSYTIRIDATGVLGGCNHGTIQSWGLDATISRH